MSNCITDSKSLAPDVRVMKVAAWCIETAMDGQKMRMTTPDVLLGIGHLLRDIAADIRAAQPDPRASMEPKLDNTADLIVSMLHAAGSMSVTEVDAVWADAADNILNLSDPDRIRCIIAWINASIRAGQGGK